VLLTDIYAAICTCLRSWLMAAGIHQVLAAGGVLPLPPFVAVAGASLLRAACMAVLDTLC
jgi:hypothetical protein